MPWLETGVERYFYLERGRAGRTILFVHGSGGRAGHWRHQLALAGPTVRILAADLPGHGQSGGRPSDRIAAYREFVRDFAGRLLPEPFYLGGHSMGGAVALDFARLYPERLAGLILVATGARLRVKPSILAALRAGEIPPELVGLAYGPAADPALLSGARQEAVHPAVYLADFLACDAFDVMAELPRIPVRTLVLVGTRDRMTPPKYAHYLGDHLPRAAVVTVADAGHMLMLEKPAAVNGAVAGFVAS